MKIGVKTYNHGTKVKVLLNKENINMEIRQSIKLDGSLPASTISESNEDTTIAGVVAYMESNEEYETTTYKYLVENIIVDIVVPFNCSGRDVEAIIKTVQ